MARIFKRQMERLCQLFCWRVSRSNLLDKRKGSDTTYAQINAKLVDYDVRFRNQSNFPQSSKSPSVTTNAFSQKRESFKNQVSQQDSSSFATSPTSSIRESINKQMPKRTYNKRREGKENYFK